MKYQILFSGKNKKNYFKMSSAENFTQSYQVIKKWNADHSRFVVNKSEEIR